MKLFYCTSAELICLSSFETLWLGSADAGDFSAYRPGSKSAYEFAYYREFSFIKLNRLLVWKE